MENNVRTRLSTRTGQEISLWARSWNQSAPCDFSQAQRTGASWSDLQIWPSLDGRSWTPRRLHPRWWLHWDCTMNLQSSRLEPIFENQIAVTSGNGSSFNTSLNLGDQTYRWCWVFTWEESGAGLWTMLRPPIEVYGALDTVRRNRLRIADPSCVTVANSLSGWRQWISYSTFQIFRRSRNRCACVSDNGFLRPVLPITFTTSEVASYAIGKGNSWWISTTSLWVFTRGD